MGQIEEQSLRIPDHSAFEALLVAEDPERLITSEAWNYWTHKLAESGSQKVTVIAKKIGIPWSGLDNEELSHYVASDLVTVRNFQFQNCMGIQSFQAIKPCFNTELDGHIFCAFNNIS
jgi:hypothetical protein